MLRNKNPFLIVTPENAGINGFARINTSFAILISDRGDFCKTYFCCQGAILVLSVTKNAWPELSFAKWSLIFHFTQDIMGANTFLYFVTKARKTFSKFVKK